MKIEHTGNNVWQVVSASGAVVFRGSERRLEDWLDARENERRELVAMCRRQKAAIAELIEDEAEFHRRFPDLPPIATPEEDAYLHRQLDELNRLLAQLRQRGRDQAGESNRIPGPQQSVDAMLKSDLQRRWPKCDVCDAPLWLVSSGLICGDCVGTPILTTGRLTGPLAVWPGARVSITRLRELFPDRCLDRGQAVAVRGRGAEAQRGRGE